MGSVVKGERCLIAINYEPPGAFNGSIAEAYGQMTAQNARAEFQLKAAEARSQAQARSQANQNQQDALAQKSYEFDQSQMPSERDQFNAAQQANQTQAHIGGQMALQQQSQQFRNQEYHRDFNYSDNLRLQNAQQQRNMISQDASMSDSEKQQALALVDPTISALTFQQRQTQMRQEREQTQRLRDQNAQATTMRILDDQFRAQALPNATIPHRDDEGNLIAITHPDGRGGYHTVPVRPQSADRPEITPQIRARFATTARSEQTREEQFAARAGQPAPAWAASQQLRDADRQRRVHEMIRDHTGSGGATRGGYEADRGALMTDLGSLLGAASPHVSPAQSAQRPNVSEAAPGTEGQPGSPNDFPGGF